jgi:hypothetical protein
MTLTPGSYNRDIEEYLRLIHLVLLCMYNTNVVSIALQNELSACALVSITGTNPGRQVLRQTLRMSASTRTDETLHVHLIGHYSSLSLSALHRQ